MNNLKCSCGENCQKAEMGFPSGIKIQVPMCLLIAGIFKNKSVMDSLKHFDLHILTEDVEKANRNLEDGQAFWKRIEKNLESDKPPLA